MRTVYQETLQQGVRPTNNLEVGTLSLVHEIRVLELEEESGLHIPGTCRHRVRYSICGS